MHTCYQCKYIQKAHLQLAFKQIQHQLTPFGNGLTSENLVFGQILRKQLLKVEIIEQEAS